MVAVGLNLSPFCCCYKNVIHSLVAVNTKEIIELQSLTKTDNWWNKIFLDEKKTFYVNISPSYWWSDWKKTNSNNWLLNIHD